MYNVQYVWYERGGKCVIERKMKKMEIEKISKNYYIITTVLYF